MGLGHLRRRANIEEMMEKARNRIAKARASINAQEGGRRAHRAHTRKVAKKGLGGLPRNVKFMGFFTRKQAEKMLGRGH